MKFRKTRQEDRNVYRYPISVPEGKGGYRTEYIIIHPREDGVTEAIIKTLHSLDDSEVYYNCKNGHPPFTEEEKTANKIWEDEHLDEKAPKNWNLSLEGLCENDDGEDFADKSKILADAYCEMHQDIPSDVERLREIVETMPQKRKEAYLLVVIEGYNKTEAAKIMGTSPANITIHINKAKEYIKENF